MKIFITISKQQALELNRDGKTSETKGGVYLQVEREFEEQKADDKQLNLLEWPDARKVY
jgi:hypothetical protein